MNLMERFSLSGLFVFLMLVTGNFSQSRTVTYFHDMEIPLDISCISMEWGSGGKVDFCYEEPGVEGKALHFTTKPIADATDPCANENRGALCANEGRCYQWNHEPGTQARIAFDFRVFEAQEKSWFKVLYYDGYVTADFFLFNQGDPVYAIPEPIVSWKGGDSMEWQRYEVLTDILEQPILTLWIEAANPCDNPGTIDAAIDNLSLTLEVSQTQFDPNFDWGGQNYDKLDTCRRSNSCRHIPWCDIYYEETAESWPGGPIIPYGLTVFRSSVAGRGLLSLGNDIWHRHRDGQVGGASVIGFASIHASSAAKSMGIRQTTSYSAWGLEPGRKGRVNVRTKAASAFPRNQDGPAGRTLLGVDPYGGVQSHSPTVLWTEEGFAHWHGHWTIHRLEFDRPPDAEALTVFLKWRDGQPDNDCDGKAPNGNSGWFDWVLVEVEPDTAESGE